MAVIQSLGALADLQPLWNLSSYSYGAVKLYDQLYYDYATLYRTQPNVRTCVDFLARNIAQLGLHVFRRVSDTDRQRLVDHSLAQLIAKPNPWTTRYRLIEALVSDLGIYWNAYWLKVKQEDRLYLLRIPPQLVEPTGGLFPRMYTVDLGGKVVYPTPDQIVHFRGYNPEDATQGLSAMETLRRILAEEFAMGDYREYFWRNSARMNGIIQRPREAPEWSKDARERFKQEFEALYAGGSNSGRTAILEEGMEWKESSFNAQESEYLGGRKLTREECARAYHIPLPMVGILDNATFSNIKEQHKNLYQDCLGPWLVMLVEDIELQLLPEFDDIDRVYLEFNIEEKLRGSFEEQMTAFQAAVGRPWMSADEARARMNMPSMGGDAARLVTPLNVLVGGQASPRDSAPPKALIATKALDDRRTAWLGMYLPAEVAEDLAIEGGESPEALHMTLVYLGSQSADGQAKLDDLVGSWAQGAASIRATVSGVGRFNLNEASGNQAFYASVDAPGLPEWRQALLAQLASSGFVADTTHGFTPHITLAYLPADAPNRVESVSDLQFVFDKLTLSFGDVRRDYLLSQDVKGRRPKTLKAVKAAAEIDPTLKATRERHVAKWSEVMSTYFGRQLKAIIGRVREGAGIETVWIDGERWDSELSADSFRLNSATAQVWAKWVADQLEAEIDLDRMHNYLDAVSENAAQRINSSTRDHVMNALTDELPRDAVKALFEVAQDSGAKEIARTGVNGAANFGSSEGARQGGLMTKTWIVNSSNPRDEHAAMAGETVGIGENFSNGMRWPGDPAGGAENNANCECSVAFGRE